MAQASSELNEIAETSTQGCSKSGKDNFIEQNYFDQSHFIKDLKKHTGNNPTELFENKSDRFLQLATMVEK